MAGSLTLCAWLRGGTGVQAETAQETVGVSSAARGGRGAGGWQQKIQIAAYLKWPEVLYHASATRPTERKGQPGWALWVCGAEADHPGPGWGRACFSWGSGSQPLPPAFTGFHFLAF